VRDDQATRWLLACVRPDHHERRRRLEGAIDLARASPPAVSAGNLVDDLSAVLSEAPDDAQLVVFHSAALSYVSRDRRQAFADTLARTSKRRDVVWIANEAAGVIPELTALAPSTSSFRFLLGRTRFANGHRRDDLIALAHPHGSDVARLWLRRPPGAPAARSRPPTTPTRQARGLPLSGRH
jgi:hypothetical protein